MNRITTAVEWGDGKAYFFDGDVYVRYDIATERADAGYPRRIAENWRNLWGSDLDAAVNWGNGKVYFFKGSEYVRYDIAADRVDPGWPKSIAAEWVGLWDRDIDAAVNWGNGKAYFFKGSEYVRYDIAADRVDPGWPKSIAAEWAGLWPSDIDAAINLGTGKACFFKGGQFAPYDIANDAVDTGFPRPIPKSWLDPQAAKPPVPDADGNRFHSGGSWNGPANLAVKGGQTMHFTLKNLLGPVGTTIKITSNIGTKQHLIPPFGSADLTFQQFGQEPMGWNFKVDTDSDAFLVGWKLFSSWIPGDPNNG